jgi:hypothetical protein
MNTGVFYLGPCRKASLLRLLRLVRMEVAVHARATRGGDDALGNPLVVEVGDLLAPSLRLSSC